MYIPPEPLPRTAQRVRSRLREVDPLLDIKWEPLHHHNSARDRIEGGYVLCYNFHEADPRKRSEPQGYDVLGHFCNSISHPGSGCVNPERMLPRIMEFLSRCDNERESVSQRLKRVHEANQKRREAYRRQMRSEGVARALAQRRQAFGIPFVSFADAN